jgi:flagellar basal body-associated protein FliL
MNNSPIEPYKNNQIEELRREIAKGLDSPLSKRKVKDIISSKINNILMQAGI